MSAASGNSFRAWSLACAASVALWALPMPRLEAANDVVYLRKAKPIRGAVVKDDVSGVVIRLHGGGQMELQASDIKRIAWDISNPEWQEGLREMKSGQYASAAASFQIISGDQTSLQTFRAVAQPYLFYLLGECLYKAAKPKEATAALEAFMKKFKTSRYVPQATARLVDAAIQSGKFSIVPPLLNRLKELGAEYRATAMLLEGDMLRAQNKPTAASSKYKEAATATSNSETRALANLGLARCAILKKDLATAKQMAGQALDSSATPVVAATAHLIVGNALFAEASKATGDPSKEKFLDAVLEFLRIPVLYSGDERTEPEALYKAGECFRRLAKFPGRGRTDKHRAASMYVTAIQRYKGSRWASKARTSLKKVR